jgi:hypothetical protein
VPLSIALPAMCLGIIAMAMLIGVLPDISPTVLPDVIVKERKNDTYCAVEEKIIMKFVLFEERKANSKEENEGKDCA